MTVQGQLPLQLIEDGGGGGDAGEGLSPEIHEVVQTPEQKP